MSSAGLPSPPPPKEASPTDAGTRCDAGASCSSPRSRLGVRGSKLRNVGLGIRGWGSGIRDDGGLARPPAPHRRHPRASNSIFPLCQPSHLPAASVSCQTRRGSHPLCRLARPAARVETVVTNQCCAPRLTSPRHRTLCARWALRVARRGEDTAGPGGWGAGGGVWEGQGPARGWWLKGAWARGGRVGLAGAGAPADARPRSAVGSAAGSCLPRQGARRGGRWARLRGARGARRLRRDSRIALRRFAAVAPPAYNENKNPGTTSGCPMHLSNAASDGLRPLSPRPARTRGAAGPMYRASGRESVKSLRLYHVRDCVPKIHVLPAAPRLSAPAARVHSHAHEGTCLVHQWQRSRAAAPLRGVSRSTDPPHKRSNHRITASRPRPVVTDRSAHPGWRRNRIGRGGGVTLRGSGGR